MATRKTERRTFEVLISFDALDVGERFTQGPEDFGWAQVRVDAGYLREVKEEAPDGGGSEVGQG